MENNLPLPEFDDGLPKIVGQKICQGFVNKIKALNVKFFDSINDGVSNFNAVTNEFVSSIIEEMKFFLDLADEELRRRESDAERFIVLLKKSLNSFWVRLSQVNPDFKMPLHWDAK